MKLTPILSASPDFPLHGAPCFTVDGRLAAIIVEQTGNTAVAIPALLIAAELRRYGIDASSAGKAPARLTLATHTKPARTPPRSSSRISTRDPHTSKRRPMGKALRRKRK